MWKFGEEITIQTCMVVNNVWKYPKVTKISYTGLLVFTVKVNQNIVLYKDF